MMIACFRTGDWVTIQSGSSKFWPHICKHKVSVQSHSHVHARCCDMFRAVTTQRA